MNIAVVALANKTARNNLGHVSKGARIPYPCENRSVIEIQQKLIVDYTSDLTQWQQVGPSVTNPA